MGSSSITPDVTTNDRRALVVGQGSLGTFFACALDRAGYGVTVLSGRAKGHQRATLGVVDQPELRCDVDLVPTWPKDPVEVAVVTSRAAGAVGAATEAARHLPRHGGLLLAVQNGLVPLDVAEAVGADRVAPVVVGFNAQMVDQRTVDVTSPGGLTLGALDPATREGITGLAGALQPTVRARVTDNVRGAVWSKWTISCAINGLAVVTGEGVGPLSRREQGREALISLVTECVGLAQARGVALERVAGPLSPDTLAGRARGGLGGWLRHGLVRLIGRRYRGVVPSSLDALRAGRDTELEQLNGRAVALAAELGRAVPWNEALLSLGRQVETGALAPGPDRLDELVGRVRAG